MKLESLCESLRKIVGTNFSQSVVSRAGPNQVRAENWVGTRWVGAQNANHWFSKGTTTDDTGAGVFPKRRSWPIMRPSLTVDGVSILKYMFNIFQSI